LDLQRRRRRRLGYRQRAGDRAVLRVAESEAEEVAAVRVARRRGGGPLRIGVVYRSSNGSARLNRGAAQYGHGRSWRRRRQQGHHQGRTALPRQSELRSTRWIAATLDRAGRSRRGGEQVGEAALQLRLRD